MPTPSGGGGGGGGSVAALLVLAHMSASQNVPNNALTTLGLNTNDYDPNAMHSTTTNNTRINIQTTGWYRITGKVGFETSNATMEWGCKFVVTGTGVSSDPYLVLSGTASMFGFVTFTYVVQLFINDFVEMQFYQNGGGANNARLGSGLALERVA